MEKLFACQAITKTINRQANGSPFRFTFEMMPTKGATDWWVAEDRGRVFLCSGKEDAFTVGQEYMLTFEKV